MRGTFSATVCPVQGESSTWGIRAEEVKSFINRASCLSLELTVGRKLCKTKSSTYYKPPTMQCNKMLELEMREAPEEHAADQHAELKLEYIIYWHSQKKKLSRKKLIAPVTRKSTLTQSPIT